MLKALNSVLIPDILVCVGMSQKSYYTPKPSRNLVCVGMNANPKYAKAKTNPKCFGMRRYESKFISQGKSNKGILGVHIP